MGLFDPSREEMMIRALRELATGCKKHPRYRYKRKPTCKCKRCLYLFNLSEEFRAYEDTREKALLVYFEQRRKEDHERYLADQDRLNCPG